MTKATISAWRKIDGQDVVQSLQAAAEKLANGDSDVVLDFTSVERIDTSALREMETLAARADEHSVKVGLRGVNIDVYKVLKLMKLSPRFSFLS